MKKRILSTILSLCMVLSLLPARVLAQELTHLSHAGWQDAVPQSIAPQSIGPTEAEVENDLYEKMSAQVSVITLISDIELNGALRIDYAVTIDLNGHALKMSDIASGSVFVIEDDGHLTLTDNNPGAQHKFTPNADGLWVLDEIGGTKTISGGIITGGNGGGVLIEPGGRLTMTGGSIVGCQAVSQMYDAGGGVMVECKTDPDNGIISNGTFTMNGGAIIGCVARHGGGVEIDGGGEGEYGTFTMNGGVIDSCVAIDGRGGGVLNDGIFIMGKGGTIKNCKAVKYDQYYLGSGVSLGGDRNILNGTIISGDVVDTQHIFVNGPVTIGADADIRANMISYGHTIALDDGVSSATIYGKITNDSYGGASCYADGLVAVTYQVDGEDYATQILRSGGTATQPVAPTVPADHTFDGWYKDGTKWVDTAPVTENLTLTGWLYHPVKDESELTVALANSSIDVIRLMSDIKLANELQITNGRKVILDLNGYVLDLAGKYISVSALSATNRLQNQLTIMDSRPTAEHKFKDDGTGLWVLNAGGDKLVKGGVITGGKATYGGGAIEVGFYGKLIMNGGNIVGCSAGYFGGAVNIINGTTFEMNGGDIMGCKAGYAGGAVCVGIESSPFGTFTMNGGSIADCTAVNGSGVYLYDKMNANGGVVGGTVLLDADGVITGGGSTFSELIINNNAQARFSGVHSPLGIVKEKPTGANGHNYCTVTFTPDGGNMPHTTRYFLQGRNISGEIKPDPRTGYTFAGWYKADGTVWNYASDKVTGDITLYAKWTPNIYTVTFDSTGGSEVITKTMDVAYGEQLGDMPVPIRTGYFFCGWYDAMVGGKCYSGSDGKSTNQYDKTENCTLYAQWKINQYTITFDTAGGSKIDSITQDYGTAITAPANPTREGYTFISWDKKIPATMPAEDITITAQWKDIEKPTGGIRVGTSKWKTFLNNITFGLFFKDTQTVTITAADNSGETVKIEYLLSAKEYTKAELDGITFTAYTALFGINPDNEYIIYVRLTDKTGNTDYICSDGIVLDSIAPVISGVENTKTYCTAQTVTITEEYVDTVTVSGTAVTLDENKSFILSAADGEQKIVVTDKAGNTAEMTVTVNDGHTFGKWESNGDGTHTHRCKISGCNGFETKECSGGTATCTEKAKCEVCHESYGDLDSNNHTDTAKWVKDAQGHEKKYICCGSVIVASEAHEWANGVCRECGYECSHDDNDKNHICDICGKTISNHKDTDKNHICDFCGKTISNHEDTDKNHICNYCGKVITNHTGGKATCKDKAICDYCGKAYGELDPGNHANLKHIPAKAATKDAEGNIEYWYCEGCDRYYSDAEALNGIVKGSILIMKLTDEPKSPKTCDNSSHMPWTALLFIGGGVCAALTVKRRKVRSTRR